MTSKLSLRSKLILKKNIYFMWLSKSNNGIYTDAERVYISQELNKILDKLSTVYPNHSRKELIEV